MGVKGGLFGDFHGAGSTQGLQHCTCSQRRNVAGSVCNILPIDCTTNLRGAPVERIGILQRKSKYTRTCNGPRRHSLWGIFPWIISGGCSNYSSFNIPYHNYTSLLFNLCNIQDNCCFSCYDILIYSYTCILILYIYYILISSMIPRCSARR